MTQPRPYAPAVWFPTVRANSGSDVFTQRLRDALAARGYRAEITWLPHRAEYLPRTVPVPRPPPWANIVHVNSWLPGRFLPMGLPLVVTVHSCVHDPSLRPHKGFLKRLYHRQWIWRLESKLFEKAQRITAVSRHTADQVERLFGRNDVRPVYNWIDTEVFRPDVRRKPHSPFRLLFVGKITRLKGADLLPRIMEKLGGGFELKYTGTEPDFHGLTLPGNMISLGRLRGDEALAAAYRACDALLFPTRLEGFGLVALEAQACGRPVIASDCTSLPEVVMNGKSGLLCPLDDVDAFVTATRRLQQDPDIWAQMCGLAREWVVSKFDEDRLVSRFLALYEDLTDQARFSR